jgi:hypothetical protein
MSDEHSASIRRVQHAIFANSHCKTGIVPKNIWYRRDGQGSQPEALCVLYVDHPYWGYCYAHARAVESGFVAYLVNLSTLVSAPTAGQVVGKFGTRICEPNSYRLPRIDATLKTFRTAWTFAGACYELAQLIRDFREDDFQEAWGEPSDLRILRAWRHPLPPLDDGHPQGCLRDSSQLSPFVSS